MRLLLAMVAMISCSTAALAGCGNVVVEVPEEPLCADPRPVLQTGQDVESGFVECHDGFVHRESAVLCVDPRPEGQCTFGAGDCATDEDCTAKPYGACVNGVYYEQECECRYGCKEDSDCAQGYLCACAGVVSGGALCIPADCASDAECGEGLCGVSVKLGSCGENFSRSACWSPASECRAEEDCASKEPVNCSGSVPQSCKATGDGDWVCGEPSPCGPCG